MWVCVDMDVYVCVCVDMDLVGYVCDSPTLSTSQSSSLLWSRLAALLNFLPSEEQILRSGTLTVAFRASVVQHLKPNVYIFVYVFVCLFILSGV